MKLPNERTVTTLACQIQVGKRLREARATCKKSQDAVAGILCCSSATISGWERGNRGMTPRDLRWYASACGMTVEDILGDLEMEWEERQTFGGGKHSRQEPPPQPPAEPSPKPSPKPRRKRARTLDDTLRLLARYNDTHKPYLTYGEFVHRLDSGAIKEEDCR